MSDRTSSSSPFAVASIIVSMCTIGAGNGLMLAYIPVRLATRGFAPWIAGAVLTAMSAGALVGCLLAGPLVRRVGHARAFATLSAGVILSALAVALGTVPVLWVLARAGYGFAVAGLFIVTQSWLNDACENAWRGRVIATFYMSYVVSLGAGAYAMGFVSLDGVQVPLLVIFASTLAILPVGLTRLRAPEPPEAVSLAFHRVWRISPVALAGLFAVGGLTMLVQGFAPIYAAAEGRGQGEIATLMFLMQFGMIGVQLPLGALSDRIDRRLVLVAACLIVIASAAVATRMSGASLGWTILVFAIWCGATESIYAVSNAHANDRADPGFYVALSSTLLVAWSVSGLVLPGLATALTPVMGPRAFMYIAMAVAALFGGFTLWRLTRRAPVPAERQEPFQPLSAQAPLSAELAPLPDRD